MDPNQLQAQQPSSTKPAQASQSPAMAAPEQRQQLFDLINQIRDKLGAFNGLSFASQNQSEQLRMDLLKDVFSQLSAAGVDLTDPKSVSDFLGKLKIQNPELAQMLEEALDTLLGPTGTTPNMSSVPLEDETMGAQPQMQEMS